MKYKVAFSIWIDKESHPQIKGRSSAIDIAKTMTTNETGGYSWDIEGQGLLFREYLYFETSASRNSQEFCDELTNAQSKCQCPDPEFNYVEKAGVLINR